MKLKFLLAFFCLSSFVHAQKDANTEKALRKMCERIMKSTTYKFVNAKTKETFDNVKNQTPNTEIKVESAYNDWHYTNGLLFIGMLELSDKLKDKQYENYVIKNMDFVFNQGNLEFYKKLYDQELKKDEGWLNVRKLSWHMFFRGIRLDDCGTMGGSLIDLYQRKPQKEYKDYFDKVADHLENTEPRLPDQTICRYDPHEMTIWADDLYMSVCFLARMGKLTGDSKYFDDAAKQIIQFTKYLWSPKKELYYHCYYSDTQENGVAHWGRCNGWVMMAQADLLSVLPKNHPKRNELIAIFKQQVAGVCRYQSGSGLWRQLLDKTDSYQEVTATAMFVYSMAKGVKNNWIDYDYTYAAERGWKGIMEKIDIETGDLEGICTGTGIMPSLEYYYNRPIEKNTAMGEAPVLRAGVEMLDLPVYKPVSAHTKYEKIVQKAKK